MVGGKRSRRHAGKAGRRGRWLRSLAAAAGVLVVAGGLAAAGTADGYPASRPKLLSGAAWLASSQVGQLTLLDGSSAEVSAQVSVAPRGNRIDVVQQAATAYVVDRTAGSLRRVDGATFDVGAVAKPIPDATGGLLAFAGPRGLYALDSSRGLLVATDPLSLTAKGAAVSLASRFDAGGAVVDEHGRLWVLDSATGDLIWLDGGKRGLRRGAVTAGAGLLVLADDAPVLVDTTARRADVLDRSTAQVRRSVTLDLRPGEQIAVSGSPHAARLYVAAARGVLSVCELTRADCATAVPLSPDATDLGSPVETGGRVFVPDYRTGQVWIVDLAGARVVARPQVLHPRTKFQLLTRDGLVFFNDPDSEQAGVIDLDGGFTPVAKYDPAHPDRNLHNPGAGGGEGPSAGQPPAGQPPVDQPQQPDTPDKAPPNKTPPPQPDPPKPPDPPSPPVPGQPRVRIVVSNTDPFVGDPVTLRATGVPGGPEPTAARWDFGDGQGGMGLRVNHQWDTPRNYQVSVQATFPDNRTATSSITLRVATRPVTRPVLTVLSPTNGVISGTGGINCPGTCAAAFDAGGPHRLGHLRAAPATADGDGIGQRPGHRPGRPQLPRYLQHRLQPRPTDQPDRDARRRLRHRLLGRRLRRRRPGPHLRADHERGQGGIHPLRHEEEAPRHLRPVRTQRRRRCPRSGWPVLPACLHVDVRPGTADHPDRVRQRPGLPRLGPRLRLARPEPDLHPRHGPGPGGFGAVRHHRLSRATRALRLRPPLRPWPPERTAAVGAYDG